jgi:hypothetical protein
MMFSFSFESAREMEFHIQLESRRGIVRVVSESFNNLDSEGAAETKWVDLGKDGSIVFNKGASAKLGPPFRLILQQRKAGSREGPQQGVLCKPIPDG